jgi:formamidopyrimidine-DNA glycosylase
MKLKAFLMDQTFLVGIGDIYSDEILFHAGLRYDRDPSSLTTQEIRRLYRSLVETSTRPSSTADDPLRRRSTSDSERQAGRVPAAPPGLRRENEPCRGAGPTS